MDSYKNNPISDTLLLSYHSAVVPDKKAPNGNRQYTLQSTLYGYRLDWQFRDSASLEFLQVLNSDTYGIVAKLSGPVTLMRIDRPHHSFSISFYQGYEKQLFGRKKAVWRLHSLFR